MPTVSIPSTHNNSHYSSSCSICFIHKGVSSYSSPKEFCYKYYSFEYLQNLCNFEFMSAVKCTYLVLLNFNDNELTAHQMFLLSNVTTNSVA
jgi:hypothetical protein